MNKKSKEIVKKLCFTLVIVISIITIIGCPNTVSNKTGSGAGQNELNPPPTDPWKIAVEGAGTNREVKVCLKKGDSDPEKDIELSLTEAESKLKEWIEGSAGDDAEIEVTFIVKNHEEGDCLKISEDFQLDKDNPNKAKLKYSKKDYPKNGIKLSFKKVQGYFDALEFKKDDPIVTKPDGLSFGSRDGKLCLLSTECPTGDGHDSWTFAEARPKIVSLIGTEDYVPEGFDSVHDGLEKRWIAAKFTKKKKDGEKWLSFSRRYTSELDGYLTSELNLPSGALKNVGFFKFADISQRFAVDKNKDIIVFATDTASSHFADWHVVFVEKVTNPKMYSFHYGPYTLRNKEENDPEVHFPNYENNKLHIFTLSGMLMDYLRKEKHVLAFNTTDFNPFKYKDDYDVYLIIGRYIRFYNGVELFGYERYSSSFRNVFKLNDYGYWKDSWEEDKSVKSESPSP